MKLPWHRHPFEAAGAAQVMLAQLGSTYAKAAARVAARPDLATLREQAAQEALADSGSWYARNLLALQVEIEIDRPSS